MFEIEIVETLSRTITVLADSEELAIQQVKEQYDNEEIVLDYRDFEKVRFHNNAEKQCKKKLLMEVLDYIYENEQIHFEELEKPDDHIFLKIKALKDML